jgi:hypothetical protein
MDNETKKSRVERPNIQIGTRLWRKYHWGGAYTVVGETSRSWLMRYDGQPEYDKSDKVPKASLPDEWFPDERDWQDWCFDKAHRNSIVRMIAQEWESPVDGAMLRKVADLIGWKEPEQKGGPR